MHAKSKKSTKQPQSKHTQRPTSKYRKELQLFKETGLFNEWFISYRKSVVLRYNHNWQRKLYEAIKRICKTTFKKRYANHKKSFNVPTYKNDTKLSTQYSALKTKQLNPKEDTIPIYNIYIYIYIYTYIIYVYI